jgi:hypothetical protein
MPPSLRLSACAPAGHPDLAGANLKSQSEARYWYGYVQSLEREGAA